MILAKLWAGHLRLNLRYSLLIRRPACFARLFQNNRSQFDIDQLTLSRDRWLLDDQYWQKTSYARVLACGLSKWFAIIIRFSEHAKHSSLEQRHLSSFLNENQLVKKHLTFN